MFPPAIFFPLPSSSHYLHSPNNRYCRSSGHLRCTVIRKNVRYSESENYLTFHKLKLQIKIISKNTNFWNFSSNFKKSTQIASLCKSNAIPIELSNWIIQVKNFLLTKVIHLIFQAEICMKITRIFFWFFFVLKIGLQFCVNGMEKNHRIRSRCVIPTLSFAHIILN